MNDELKYSLNNLKYAFVQLNEGCAKASGDLEKDGVIHRFKYIFELLWKTLRIFLMEKGINVNSPKDSFKEAFRLEWVKSEEDFIQMLEDRNKTSHVYSREKSIKIFNRIKEIHQQSIKGVIAKLDAII